MKKCYSLLRWPCLLQDVLTDVYCSKQTGSSSTKGNHHPSFSFLELGRRKLSMQPKFVYAENVVKTGNPANIRKWIARFYYFRHLYSAGSACVLLTIIAWVAHRYGQLYLHCSLMILLGSFQLFLHSDQPLSEGEIIPFSGVCQSGGGCIIHAEAASRTDWQTALMCNRRRPAATSSRRASFSALASANSFVYFASSAATSRWRICMSVIAVRQLQFGIFVALGL